MIELPVVITLLSALQPASLDADQRAIKRPRIDTLVLRSHKRCS